MPVHPDQVRCATDAGSTVAEARERIRAQHHAQRCGYRIEWAGEFDELQQAKARLEVIISAC